MASIKRKSSKPIQRKPRPSPCYPTRLQINKPINTTLKNKIQIEDTDKNEGSNLFTPQVSCNIELNTPHLDASFDEQAYNFPSTPEIASSFDQDTEIYCYHDCVLDRKNNQAMIQCSLCMKRFHEACSDIISLHTVWTCNQCRYLASNVSDLKEQVSELHESLSNLLSTQNDFYKTVCEISATNAKLVNENKLLKKQLYEYRIKSYNQLSSSDSSCSDSEPESDFSQQKIVRKKKQVIQKKPANKSETNTVADAISSEPKFKKIKQKSQSNSVKSKLTVIGDSIIRDTGKTLSTLTKNYDTCVLSKSGYRIEDAASNMHNLVHDHQDTENDVVVLQIGTNDLQHHNQTQLAEKYNHLIKNTKKAVPKSSIIVTALPNRISSSSMQINKKINLLNRSLRQLCETEDRCYFADCTPELIVRNFKYDGYHFTNFGTKEFATSLSDYINSNFPGVKTQISI